MSGLGAVSAWNGFTMSHKIRSGSSSPSPSIGSRPLAQDVDPIQALANIKTERKVRGVASADTVVGSVLHAKDARSLADVKPGILTARANSEGAKVVGRVAKAVAQQSGLSLEAAEGVARVAARAKVVPVVSTVAGAVFATQDTQAAIREQGSRSVSGKAKALNWVKAGAGWTSVAADPKFSGPEGDRA